MREERIGVKRAGFIFFAMVLMVPRMKPASLCSHLQLFQQFKQNQNFTSTANDSCIGIRHLFLPFMLLKMVFFFLFIYLYGTVQSTV